MELPLKSRNIHICNIKAILIFLVVLGHVLETVPDSAFAAGLYKFIYIFHMPMFVFLSGYFTRRTSACLKQFRTSLLIFIIFQPLFLLYNRLITGQRQPILTPYHHLWYIFALSVWSLTGVLFIFLNKHNVRKPVILACTAAVSLLAGGAACLGRTLALQRIFAFLPYYYLGMITDIGKVKNSRVKYLLLPLSAASCFLIMKYIPTSFLYQAVPYDGSFLSGAFLRLICEAGAVSVVFFLLSVIPSKRIFITALGKDTLPVYLLHPLFLPFAEFMIGISPNRLISALLYASWITAILYLTGKLVRPVGYLA